MIEINGIEKIGMTNRINQIQQRISNIETTFAATETKFDANKIGADFQTKLDAEIERQDKVAENLKTSVESQIGNKKILAENKVADKKIAVENKIGGKTQHVNENEIINSAKIAEALKAGAIATLNVISPETLAKKPEVEKLPAENQNLNQNFNQNQNSDTESLIKTAAQNAGIDPALVRAVAIAESDMNQNEISPVGAIGVMQLMPETAAALGVNPYDERQNIQGGANYLRQMLDKFNGNVPHALAAYNAGPGAVQKYGGVPPYKETQNYVGRIMDIISG